MGPVYISFKNIKFRFLFSGLFPGHLFIAFSDSKFRRLGLLDRGFRMEGIANICFSWKSFFMNFGIDFRCFFGGLGNRFSGFLGLENRFANRRIFW